MRIDHRGVTFQLEDTDPRVRLMECILFGEPLPPPLPAPAGALPGSPARAAEATPATRALWAELTELEQRELVLLTARSYRPDELEKALGASAGDLQTAHSRLRRLSNARGVLLAVRTSGSTRRTRRYALETASVDVMRALIAAGIAKA